MGNIARRCWGEAALNAITEDDADALALLLELGERPTWLRIRLSFLLGSHSRAGVNSPIMKLGHHSTHVMQLIFDHVSPWVPLSMAPARLSECIVTTSFRQGIYAHVRGTCRDFKYGGCPIGRQYIHGTGYDGFQPACIVIQPSLEWRPKKTSWGWVGEVVDKGMPLAEATPPEGHKALEQLKARQSWSLYTLVIGCKCGAPRCKQLLDEQCIFEWREQTAGRSSFDHESES